MGNQFEQYRQQVKEKCLAEISQEVENMRNKGLYPFEGKWRAMEEIVDLQKLMKKKDRIILKDLFILLLILIFLNLLIINYLFGM
jgi:hypothetical protein